MKQMRRWLVPLALALIVIAAVPALAWGLGGDGKTVDPSVPSDSQMMSKPAPIESVDVEIKESFPPQYVARVKFGLPSGCAEPGGYKVERDGDTINVKVYILQPADPNTICTAIYGIGSYDVELGKGFTSGRTYTVVVGDKSVEFKAQ